MVLPSPGLLMTRRRSGERVGAVESRSLGEELHALWLLREA